jgi:methyl-accepting chemotaxis protein PixJ
MHYTGMAAATFTASGIPSDSSHSVTVTSLGTLGIITVTLLVLGFTILSSYVDRRFHAQALELVMAQARLELAYVGRVASLGELVARQIQDFANRAVPRDGTATHRARCR